MSLINIFPSVIEVLEIIIDDGSNNEQRYEANNLLGFMQSFEFVFNLHLMRTILGVTNELSRALQRKDQDIVNAMTLVKICKQRLQIMRECGWDSFLSEVYFFCEKHKVDVPNMDAIFKARGRSRHKAHEITNLHYFQIDLFFVYLQCCTCFLQMV